MIEVQELSKAKSIPALVSHATTGRMLHHDIKADMITHVPALEILFDKWGEVGTSALATFQLTAVGIAIGHACQRKIVTDMAPLDVFLL
jgi:hypothetical protein